MTLEVRGAERQVPFDDRSEQPALGSLLLDRDAIFKAADLLRADDFYIPRNRLIYDAARALLERRVVDQPVARDVEVVGAKEVGDLEDRVPVDEQAPEDLLLGAIIERHLPLGAAHLERHLHSIEQTF